MDACVCNAFWLNDPLDPPKKYTPGDFIEEIDIFEVFGKSTFRPSDSKTSPNDRIYFTTTHRAKTPYVESKVWLGREVKGKMYFRIKFKIAIFRLASNGKNKLSTTYTSYFYN